MAGLPKRLLVGTPLHSSRMGETLLPKKLALPVFCSDPLSSNAYATEEILLMLSLGGLALLHVTPWVAAAVVLLLVIVVLSYRQTCHAYPDGGGAYAVSRANLGRTAALVAASALLVDYVLTVAVSVCAGVANIVSAVPQLAPHVVLLSVGVVIGLALMNLRGIKESGSVFAVPTYGFVVVVLAMIGLGLVKVLGPDAPVAESATIGIKAEQATGGARRRCRHPACLRLRVHRPHRGRGGQQRGAELQEAQGPQRGVDPGHHGWPDDRHVRRHHGTGAADRTCTSPPTRHSSSGAPAGYTQRTVIAQIAAAVFGNNSVGFFAVQAFTAAILVLAANTAFNGFPILASILGEDGFLPRQFARRGDRLVFSNGIVILSFFAVALIIAFNASTTRLIQLYIIGVFVSFTLSQSGMVKHWRTADATQRQPRSPAPDAGLHDDQRRRCDHHRGGARHRAGHQVHPRCVDRGHHHAAAVPADDRHPQALRGRRGRTGAQARRCGAAQPHPRPRARLQAQHPGPAGPGLRQGVTPQHPDRRHGPHERPARRRPCAGTGSSWTSRCRC